MLVPEHPPPSSARNGGTVLEETTQASRPSEPNFDPMLSLHELVRAVKDAGGGRRFDAKALDTSLQDFQGVVDLIRDADQHGFFEVVKEHVCSRTRLVDCVWVEGVTEDGEDFLSAA